MVTFTRVDLYRCRVSLAVAVYVCGRTCRRLIVSSCVDALAGLVNVGRVCLNSLSVRDVCPCCFLCGMSLRAECAGCYM